MWGWFVGDSVVNAAYVIVPPLKFFEGVRLAANATSTVGQGMSTFLSANLDSCP